jgi:uncharacterized protein DUF2752
MSALGAHSARPAQPLGATELATASLCAASLGAVALGAISGEDAGDGPTLCPFRLVTGLPCPFCGLTRSLFALGRGRVGDSLHLSPLGFAAPFAALLLGGLLLAAAVRRRPLSWPPRAGWAGGGLVAASWMLQLSTGGI